MSKSCGWVPIDKSLVHLLNRHNRPYSILEAMMSYSCDSDKGRVGSISGYATLWQWSRNKVRRFIRGISSDKGYIPKGEHYPIHYIDPSLWMAKNTEVQAEDRQRADKRHRNPTNNWEYQAAEDKQQTTDVPPQDTTIYPKQLLSKNHHPLQLPNQLFKNATSDPSEAIEDYIRLAVANAENKCKINDIYGYKAKIRARIATQGGLSEDELRQLKSWQQPQITPKVAKATPPPKTIPIDYWTQGGYDDRQGTCTKQTT